jgi:hypothetical protein
LAAGCALVVPSAIGLFVTGVPSIVSPFPLLTFTPAFWLLDFPGLHKFFWAAALVPPVLFFVWNPGLFSGETDMPVRTTPLLAVATLLNAIWIVGFWEVGLKYHGAPYTYAVAAANAVWMVLLWGAFARHQRRASFKANLLFHWLLFAWLAWYAFPYLGEL